MARDEQTLSEFVRTALERGASRDQIEQALLGAGWRPEQISQALAGYSDQGFVTPVPRPRPYVSARDAFYYLLLFSTLGLSAFYFCDLVFDVVNIAFPDLTDTYRDRTRAEDGIRFAAAVLIVAFPLYLFLTARIAAEIKQTPEKRASRVRKWLTYIALFVTGIILVCDASALIYQFLKGDLTVRVALKILTVAAVAGTIFTYYLRSSARDEEEA